MTKRFARGQRVFAFFMALLMVVLSMPMNALTTVANAVTTNSDGYIEVRTIEDLYNIRDDLTANYILMNDIDLTEATALGGDWDFMGNGWNPIGSDDVYSNLPFSGIFNGNGHSIVGMRIDISSLPSGSSTVCAGLFSNVTGTVKNLVLTGGSVSYLKDEVFYVGSVAGTTSGTIENCHNTMDLSGQAGPYDFVNGYVGGFSGYAYESAVIRLCSNSGTITSKSTSSNITATGIGNVDNYAGGIVGKSETNAKIFQCYNEGDVTASGNARKHNYGYDNYSDAYSAGISNGGKVTESYNAGTVLSTSEIRANFYAYGIGGKAIRCYNVGIVTGSSLARYAISSECTNSYYLAGTGTSSDGATSLTETQMKIQSMYKGFDFENVWVLNPYANHPYPQLRDNIQDLSESAELVSIIALPAKTEYFTGDTLDFTGAMVKVVYVSGREEIVDITNDIVSGFDMNTVGEQSVTVTVAGASDTYTINVVQRPVVESISVISPPSKTQFAIGTAFVFSGAKVLISYVGGITEEKAISYTDTTGGNINHIGKQTITYTFGGKSTTFEVEVLGITLDKIVLTSLPTKLSYLEGQELDLAGMVVTAVMNNGFESTVGEGYTVSGYATAPGTHTVTVTYLEKTASFEVTVAQKKMTSLVLNTLPDKMEYISGQAFDESGMQVIATYDNGDVVVVEDYTVSGFDATPGIKNVVITLDGKSVSFSVKVIARVITEFHLAALPTKLDYIEYDSLDITGLKVEATYNDGVTEEITDYALAGFSSKPGTHTISVAYEGFVKSFEVNVIPRALVDVKVTAPQKVTYYLGDEFDPAGMVVKACYNNGQEITVDDYQMIGFDSSTPGAKEIAVTYGGISRSFAVAVQEKSVIETGGNMIVGNLIGRLGETVEVPVSVTKNTGLAGFTHTIKFNAANLKFVSAAMENGFENGTVIVNDEKVQSGEITVLWFAGSDVAEDGVVYNLTFEILETAQDGNTEITISFDGNDTGNVSGENVLFGTVNGFVEIRSYWLGDLTGDREYHMADLLQLAQYVSGKAMTLTEKQKLSADVNEDNFIDIHDVILLQQWILVAGA